MSMTEASGPVKHASIAASTSGANTIVAAVAGLKIRILALVLNNNDATNPVVITTKDSDGGNVIGPIRLASGGTLPLCANGLGYGETPAGKGLSLDLSGAIAVGGCITYQEVK